MKKISIILCVVGLALISVSLILNFVKKGNISSNDKEWHIIYGEENNTKELLEYNVSKLDTRLIYSVDEHSNNVYQFAIPEDIVLESVTEDGIHYGNDIIKINYYVTAIENFNDEELYKSYLNNYHDIVVYKYVYNESVMGLLIKYSDNAENYNEEFILCYKDSNRVVKIIYEIESQTFSSDLLNNLLNKFEMINNSKNDICSNNKCQFALDQNKEFTLTVNGNYQYAYYGSFNAYRLDFHSVENNNEQNNSNIMINVYYDRDNNIIDEREDSLLGSYDDKKELKINNKKIISYVKNDVTNNNYEKKYLVSINDNLCYIVKISSINNDTDEIIKDFLNYEVN